MSYYVEPDYWIAGYADGDYVPGTVLVAGLCSATATIKAAAIYKPSSGGLSLTTSAVLAGGNFTQAFPGINLNSKSQVACAGNITTTNSGLVQAQSDVRMSGRPFWEMTSPASGTWVKVAPQAEGFGP